MYPFKDNLETLAKAYVMYLVHRDETDIKKHLSLNFITRQKVSEQLRMIRKLPSLLYGIGIEISLYDQYNTSVVNDAIAISPFQFGVCYASNTNLVDIEKITITVNGVILENNEWKIESIISDDEKELLLNVIENFQKNAIM